MSFFKSLPSVKNCCFCINLKLGSILIAIYFMINSCASVVAARIQPCKENANALQTAVHYSIYIVLMVQLVVLIISVAFIVGIIMDKPKTATWFMYAVSLITLLVVLFVLMTMVAAASNLECSIPYPEICISLVTQVVVWIYFTIVVKSYQEQAESLFSLPPASSLRR